MLDNDVVNHGGEDGAEAVGFTGHGALLDPVHGARDGGFSERQDFGFLPEFDEFVRDEEGVGPTHAASLPSDDVAFGVVGIGEKFGAGLFVGELAHFLIGGDDHERHEHAT